MSHATLEKTAVGAAGTDLASLVIAYHRRAHTSAKPADCAEEICRVAHQCISFEEMFFGMDDN